MTRSMCDILYCRLCENVLYEIWASYIRCFVYKATYCVNGFVSINIQQSHKFSVFNHHFEYIYKVNIDCSDMKMEHVHTKSQSQ